MLMSCGFMSCWLEGFPALQQRLMFKIWQRTTDCVKSVAVCAKAHLHTASVLVALENTAVLM